MTTTSPPGRKSQGQMTWKKNMTAIAIAHGIPYAATACSSYPFDLYEKVKKAQATIGPSYIHILSVCPTGWRIPPDQAIRYGRLAVETGVFPLYECENGNYRMTIDFPQLRPLSDYLQGQGRFRHLTPESMAGIEKRIKEEYLALKAKVKTETPP
jgi:pyruvate ferredoxin oxidoreductase beta subunit